VSISAIARCFEKGIFTNSTQERLLRLENDKAILEEKIAVEKAHSLKPLEKKNIVNFLKIYASKDLIVLEIEMTFLTILFQE